MRTRKLVTHLSKGIITVFILLQPTSCMVMHVTHHIDNASGQSVYKDPVNGEAIKDTAASLKYVYQNKTYYFSSETCQKVFQRNPERFTTDTHEHHSNMPFIMGGIIMGGMMLFMMGYWAHAW